MFDLSPFSILLVFKSLVNQNLSAATPRIYSYKYLLDDLDFDTD
jgi:hypothetical protein